jgi:hypothetical protein
MAAICGKCFDLTMFLWWPRALWDTDTKTSQYSHGGGAAATTAEPSRLLAQSLVNVLRGIWVVGKGWGILPLAVLTLCYRPCKARIQTYVQREPHVTITYQLRWVQCQKQRWRTENNVKWSNQGLLYTDKCDIYTPYTTCQTMTTKQAII